MKIKLSASATACETSTRKTFTSSKPGDPPTTPPPPPMDNGAPGVPPVGWEDGWVSARTRETITDTPNNSAVHKPKKLLRRAAEEVARRITSTQAGRKFDALVSEILAEVTEGVWNPMYWQAAKILSDQYLGSVPTTAADPAPPPYAYRTVLNMPTTSAFPAGVPDTAPARYAGQKIGDLFHDTLLVWRRLIFKLVEPPAGALYEPRLILFDGELTATSDMRGSRPMLSYVVRSTLTSNTGAALTSTASPVDAVPPSAPATERGYNSIYWRFEIPDNEPPYFSLSEPQRFLKELADISSLEPGGALTRAVVALCPRPMFGRGFNNNTEVQTELTGEPVVYQIKPQRSFSLLYQSEFYTAEEITYPAYGRTEYEALRTHDVEDLTLNLHGTGHKQYAYAGGATRVVDVECATAVSFLGFKVVTNRVDTKFNTDSGLYLSRWMSCINTLAYNHTTKSATWLEQQYIFNPAVDPVYTHSTTYSCSQKMGEKITRVAGSTTLSAPFVHINPALLLLIAPP